MKSIRFFQYHRPALANPKPPNYPPNQYAMKPGYQPRQSLFSIRNAIATALLSLALRMIANAADQPLTVAVSLDIPPYVMSNATTGIQVDIVRQTLAGRSLKWVQMDYDALESAVPDKKADVAMSVHEDRQGVYYSTDYIGFVNVAISRKADHLAIKDIASLAGHPVLTWQNAWAELGDLFKRQYAPGSPQRTNYVEVANQADQVRRFWEGKGKVIVIDRSIFDYFSEEMGHSTDGAEYHDLFPATTRFKAAFADAATREEFNARLRQLCASGEYNRLLKHYHMPESAGICPDKRK